MAKSQIPANTVALLAYTLGFVYIVFGLLKVFNISPVQELVIAMFSLMQNSLVFTLLGIGEVGLGVGVIWPKTRKWASLGIMLHLLSIFGLALLNPGQIFSATTVVSFAGEFIAKNVVLIVAAWLIYQHSSLSPRT